MSPARAKRARAPQARATGATRRVIPTDVDTLELRAGPRAVHLTNLRKPFWPELGNVRYGVAMARRGWVRCGEVLNTRSAPEFARSVAPTGLV